MRPRAMAASGPEVWSPALDERGHAVGADFLERLPAFVHEAIVALECCGRRQRRLADLYQRLDALGGFARVAEGAGPWSTDLPRWTGPSLLLLVPEPEPLVGVSVVSGVFDPQPKSDATSNAASTFLMSVFPGWS